MKFASVALVVATIALVSFDRASAVSTCSEADAQTILLLTNQIFSDVNCLSAMNDECPGEACFATLEKVTKQMPNCVAGSINPRMTFEQLLKACKAASSTSSTTTTTTPTIITTTTPTIITTTKTPLATTTTTATKTPSATTANSIDSSISTTAAPSAATTAPSAIIISPNAGTNTGTSAATAGRSSSFSVSAGVVLSFAVVVTAFFSRHGTELASIERSRQHTHTQPKKGMRRSQLRSIVYGDEAIAQAALTVLTASQEQSERVCEMKPSILSPSWRLVAITIALVSMVAIASVSATSAVTQAACGHDETEVIVALMANVLMDKDCLGVADDKCPANTKCLERLARVAMKIPECSSGVSSHGSQRARLVKLLNNCKPPADTSKSAESAGFAGETMARSTSSSASSASSSTNAGGRSTITCSVGVVLSSVCAAAYLQ